MKLYHKAKFLIPGITRFILRAKSLTLLRREELDSFGRFLLSKLTGVDPNIYISAENKKLTYTVKSNSGIESFNINEINKEIYLSRSQSIIFTVLESNKAIDLLNQELIHLKILRFFVNKSSQKLILSNSINKLTDQIKSISCQKKSLSIHRFNNIMYGKIQYYYNNNDDDIHLNFHNSVILYNNNNNINYNLNQKKERIILFYIDNISQYTVEKIIKGNSYYPNLSNIFCDKNYFSLKNHLSITNWTKPAAISMLSGLAFEEHKIFHPNPKYWLPIIEAIYNSKHHEVLSKLKNQLPTWYRCGTNWRMIQEHGIMNIFDHCITNPEFSDCYITFSQAIKQIQIAGEQPSFHWIDLMDAHHPINDIILPLNDNKISKSTIEEGLMYATGPKEKSKRHIKSSSEIYKSQLKVIDNIIGGILNQSYNFIDKEKHMIGIISDHGSNFIKWNSKRNMIIEKHSPHIGFLRNNLSTRIKTLQENKPFHAENLLSTIQDIFLDEISLDEIIGNAPYSQIFYPGNKYEFFCILKTQEIFHYHSKDNVPKTIKATNPDRKVINNLFREGLWEKFNLENNIINLKPNQIPNEVNIAFNKVWKGWLN